MSLSGLAASVPETIANSTVVLAGHEITRLMIAAFKQVQNGNHEARAAVALVPGATSEPRNWCHLVSWLHHEMHLLAMGDNRFNCCIQCFIICRYKNFPRGGSRGFGPLNFESIWYRMDANVYTILINTNNGARLQTFLSRTTPQLSQCVVLINSLLVIMECKFFL